MKSIFASKTAWLAILQAVAGVVLTFNGSTTGYLGIGLILKSVIDVVLRMMTDSGVSL